MGEDPTIYNKNNFEGLIEVVKIVKEEVKLPIMFSPWVLPIEKLL
jgi:hypothetical protein